MHRGDRIVLLEEEIAWHENKFIQSGVENVWAKIGKTGTL